jgi:hypothetical protein
MKPRILLINPPIYDFSEYDFWVKPFLCNQAEFRLVDFLDRLDSRVPAGSYRSDRWGGGASVPHPGNPRRRALPPVDRHGRAAPA